MDSFIVASTGEWNLKYFDQFSKKQKGNWHYCSTPIELDKLLETTMRQICKRVHLTAEEYGVTGNYVHGANIAGFKKVADAMIAEGI